MILYIDTENRIKDVDTTSDSSLTPIEVEETPFDGWSVAKICCYKVYLSQIPIYPEPEKSEEEEEEVEPEPIGYKTVISGFTPYVDSRLIEHIDALGNGHEDNASKISENSEAEFDLADLADENSNSIFELADMIAELQSKVEALEGGN